LALADVSRAALDELAGREGLQFGHRRNGKIVFYATEASLAAAVRQHALQAELGSRQIVLTRDECIDLEPALRAAAGRICGAIHTPSEELGDCLLLCRELQRVLERPPYEVRFRLGSPVERLVGEQRRVRAVRLARESLEADLYVLAAGWESRALARPLGLRLPLYPIRGYSISPPVADATRAPETSITDYAARIVYAPMGDRLRVAGFADIVPPTAPVAAARIAALGEATAGLFPGACDLARLEAWAGARPASPTGVPIIGRTRWANLLVNVGHGALGFTLAAGSGRMLADMAAGRRAVLEERDFALPESTRAERAASGRILRGGV
jgi:D-amino-acid dehydrogenase